MAESAAGLDTAATATQRNAAMSPSLYQINTRVWLRQRGDALGRPATLDDIENAELDQLAARGFDWIWFLGVWRTGTIGRQLSLSNDEWQRDYRQSLPDISENDVCGSCFAISGYYVHPDLGGNPALRRLRRRLNSRGLRLMLDFVPNHTAIDHLWAWERPELYVRGTPAELEHAPQNYRRIDTARGPAILAHGRDPYFPGWADTLQLNYGNPDTQAAVLGELMQVADLCDGVRCDMAMLLLPDVFARTWGIAAAPFWPDAIAKIRQRYPRFLLMAEVYWDLEWALQEQGFDYTYDKRLYDRLRDGAAGAVRDHLRAGMDYQGRLARFLENHDEPRAAQTFPWPIHQAVAVVTFLAPGLRFFHQGQFEGRTKRIPVHLNRAATEPVDPGVAAFYERLLPVLPKSATEWGLLEIAEAWPGNWTWGDFIAFGWRGAGGEHRIAVVNFADHESQCFVRGHYADWQGATIELNDRLGPARYVRSGDELLTRGLYLDLPPYGYHVFSAQRRER